MFSRRTGRLLTGTAAVGALLSGAAAAGQPAAAASYPWGISLYTGVGETGVKTEVDLNDTSCHNLSVPQLSVVDVSDSDLYAYFNADCRTGEPGKSGDTYWIVGSLHQGDSPFPIVSYRVVHDY
ncbi:hypothetical protein ACLMNJ_29290 [Streptomyces seoulensis]